MARGTSDGTTWEQTSEASSHGTPEEGEMESTSNAKEKGKGAKQSSKKPARDYDYFSYKMGYLIFSLEVDCLLNIQPRSRGRIGTRQFSKL